MDNVTEQSTAPNHAGGIAGDMRRLKSDSSAAAGELREFIGRMRGKSTQEVLGVIAQSGLVRCICASAVVFVALIAVFTVVPYLLKSDEAAAAKPASSTSQPAAVAEPDEPAATQAAATESPAPPAGNPQATPPDAAAAAAALGLDETKQAPPDKNPLEKDLDNLLDGVK